MENVFDHTNHKRMWQWLAENPGKEKDEWPKWEFNGGHIPEALNDCFACDYTKAPFTDHRGVTRFQVECKRCPLLWGTVTDYFICEKENSPYIYWTDYSWEYVTKTEVTADERVRLAQEVTSQALAIKNLFVVEGVKTK